MSGCITGISWIGNSYIEYSGLLQAADTNKVVLVFPQTLSSPTPLAAGTVGGIWGYLEGLSFGGIGGILKDMPLPQRGALRCMMLLPCYIVSQELPYKRTPTMSDKKSKSQFIYNLQKEYKNLPHIFNSLLPSCRCFGRGQKRFDRSK